MAKNTRNNQDWRHTNEKVGVRVGKVGVEVYALAKISVGEFIVEFDGRVITADDYIWKSSFKKYYYDHVVRLGKGRWRVSSGIAHLIDHSCEPNLDMVKDGDDLLLYANREIKTNEALTWDYGVTEKGGTWKMECLCGQPRCRKTIP